MISIAEVRHLARLVRRPEALLFVGSGISTWAGLPNWERLLEGLIQEASNAGLDTIGAQAALKSGKLLEAADKLPATFRRTDVTRALRHSLGFGQAKPHDIHALITKLGVTNFVTTNYDSLIEQQLTLDGVRGRYLLATSTRVAEMADIIKANSRNFVFKPHGDLDDAASLVLSSSDYEKIMGNRHNGVHRTLETLFLTRPVIFVGYSLNDPDTELLLRSINSDFLGEAGDLHAILPGSPYDTGLRRWTDLRVRSFGYPVSHSRHGSNDHQALLDLLSRIVSFSEPTRSTALPDRRKLLAMYAARFDRPVSGFLMPLTVHHMHYNRTTELSQYNGSALDNLIETHVGSFILEGPAGSGKSFALAEYLARSSRRLLAWQETGRPIEAPPIPVLLDARLYKGDFRSLAAATVPAELELSALSYDHEVVLLVDSIDEMPSEYLETGSWRKDLEQFSKDLKRVRTVYGTRRHSLVDRHHLPVFVISRLDDEAIDNALECADVRTTELSPELRRALRTPFVVGLARRLELPLANVQSASPLYAAFVRDALRRAFGGEEPARISNSLTSLAVEVVGSGRDTLPIARVIDAFDGDQGQAGVDGRRNKARDWMDRLVAAGLLDSQIDQNVRFAHRSISEYLASNYILESWTGGTLDVANVLSDRRWDDTFAFAASSMTASERLALLRAVIKVDFGLGLRVASVAEVGQDTIWRVVIEIAKDLPISYDFGFQDSAPPPQTAAEDLYSLILVRDDDVGMWAAKQLRPYIKLYVERFLADLTKNRIQFNCAQELGSVVGDQITKGQLDILCKCLAQAAAQDPDASNDDSPWSHVFPFVISGVPTRLLPNLLDWASNQSEAIRKVVAEGVFERKSAHVAAFLRKEFERANERVLFELTLARNRKVTFDKTLNQDLVDKFLHKVASNKYVLRSLIALLRSQPSLQHYAAQKARALTSELRDAWNAFFSDDAIIVSEAVNRLLGSGPESDLASAILAALLEKETGVIVSADSLIAACKRLINQRQTHIGSARSILSSMHIYRANYEIASIRDLVRYIDAVADNPYANSTLGLATQLLLDELNKVQLPHKLDLLTIDGEIPDWALATIIARLDGISTDDLETRLQARLLPAQVAWFGRLGGYFFWDLGRIATDKYVERFVMAYARTLPATAINQRTMVERLLTEAGRVNGRRYFPPWRRT